MKYANCYDRYKDLTPQIVEEMREWCLDCVSGLAPYDEEADIRAASDDAIVAWVARQYDGGVRGFCADGNY